MSAGKIALAVLGGLVVVGGVVAVAHAASKPSKLSPGSGPSSGGQQYGQGTTVQGRSGNIWLVARVLNPGPVAAGVNVFAVFPVSPDQLGTSIPMILFAQQGSDMSSRMFVSGQNNNLAATARADFGV